MRRSATDIINSEVPSTLEDLLLAGVNNIRLRVRADAGQFACGRNQSMRLLTERT